MISNTRTKNTKRNIMFGLLRQVLGIVLPFLARTTILYILGEQYVGLSSLFSSILQVLNLAELGFSTAVVYHMYGPIAEGDRDTVCALLNYYRKVYSIIGTVILIVGIGISFSLPSLIKGTWPNDINIYFLYFLYLASTVASYYLFSYKSALLNAMQRLDVVEVALLIVQFVQYILQIISIIIWKNYYVFVMISVVASMGSNLLTAYFSNKMYPDFQPKGDISPELRKKIRAQIGGVMIGKLSDASRNSFDSIIISMLFGLSVVGIYNNYYYIYSSLYSIMLVITHAMQASVGNSIVIEDKEKNYQDLRKFQFVFSWITGWCTVCLVCLYQPFMKLWVGERLMLSTLDMCLFSVYFYVICLNCMRNLYFSGAGLWWQGKKVFLYESIANLILNVVLGKKFGITGILLATIITIIVFNYIWRTYILFDKYFEKSTKEYYHECLVYTIVTICICIICFIITNCISMEGFCGFIVKAIVCVLFSNVLFLLLHYRNVHFKNSVILLRSILQKNR